MIRSDIPHAGITPACAGSTKTASITYCLHGDHPRLRGEYERALQCQISRGGSPPLARGVPLHTYHYSLVQRITPACAGSTYSQSLHPEYPEDHPRLRGEYIHVQAFMPDEIGSPPLARGVPSEVLSTLLHGRITPACAGSTPVQKSLHRR